MPNSTKPAATETYAAAYARLNTIAERLRTAPASSSIDSLVDDVRAARAAYDICRARIATIQSEIDAELAAAHIGTDMPNS